MLSFGSHSVQAINYDIALVRLAKEMVDERRYGLAMRSALHLQMEAESNG